jgi:hypothetical protein
MALLVFLLRVRTSGFTRRALFFGVLATVSLCAVLYASPFHMAWAGQPANRLGVFPITINSGLPSADDIQSSTAAYWLFSVALTWVFIAFPLSTMGAWMTTTRSRGPVQAILLAPARLAAYGITVVVALIAISVTAGSMTYSATNRALMLGGCAVFVALILKSGGLWPRWALAFTIARLAAVAAALVLIVVSVQYLIVPNPNVNPLVVVADGALLLLGIAWASSRAAQTQQEIMQTRP